jgi:pyruvate, orthophosphate dikinase
MADKLVYFFGNKEAEGSGSEKDLLGGKGANLAEMDSIGIPVPPGFTVTTKCCLDYLDDGSISDQLRTEVDQCLARVEKAMGLKYADKNDPMLMSCRSGARVSMPGMMDTVLNIGLNDDTVQGLIAKSGNERFGYDSYRRLIQMYGDVVMGVEGEKFEDAIDALKESRGVDLDTDLTIDDLKAMIVSFKKIVKDETGRDFPTDPKEQLWGSIEAVFKS